MVQLSKKLSSFAQSCQILILILLISNIQNCHSDCRLDDMMFVEGQSTGHVKMECVNETSYDGLETICGPDGKFIEVENQFTCGNTVPNCVQCGERGADAALCLFRTDAVKEDCAMFGNVITKSPNGPPPIPCVVEADCPIADDPYCGYHCLDETCRMWCEIAQQQCISESDCPIADDPYCGYSCLDGACEMYCESITISLDGPPSLGLPTDPTAPSSCVAEEDCPIGDDPLCVYGCFDGTCAMYCEGGLPTDLSCVAVKDCPIADDPYCGYSCLDGTPIADDPYCGYHCFDGLCAMWCEIAQQQCISESDCPIGDDPLCVYGCFDGTCAMYCEDQLPTDLASPALPEPPIGCLVGDIMYVPGQSIGEIGLECIDSTTYDSRRSECGVDGIVTSYEGVSTCPSVVPFCVQCGPRGIGAALCLSTETTDRDCGESESTTLEAPLDPTLPSSCVVEADCPIADDPYCGYHCLDETCRMWCESAQQQCISESDCPIVDDPYCGYSCLDGACEMYCESQKQQNVITKSLDGPPPLSCVAEEDCPIPDDPYCGYSCLDGTCALYCEGGLPTDPTAPSSCVAKEDCPVADDPLCVYSCSDGTCELYCQGGLPPDPIARPWCVAEEDCPIADDPYCGYSCLDGTCALYCEECNPEVDPNCCATMIPPSSFPPDDSTCWQWWTPPANGILSPGTPPPKGCDYQPCQDAVCACDSYCCDTAWDLSCRGYETAQGDMAENNYFVDGCSAMMLCCEPESAVPKPPIGGE